MSVLDLDEAAFDALAAVQGISVVDFHADWCGPCQRMAVEFEKSADSNPDVTFARVDVEVERSLAQAARIGSLPTLIVIRDGWLVHRSSGVRTSREINRLVEEARTRRLDGETSQPRPRLDIGRLWRRPPIRLSAPRAED